MLTKNRLILAAALLASLLVSTGCTALDARAWTAPLEPLWFNGKMLMSETVVVDGVALAYEVGEEQSLVVSARDARTGEQLWRQQALPGTDAPGSPTHVAVTTVEGRAVTAFLAPGREGDPRVWGDFAIHDVVTGARIGSAEDLPVMHSARPTVCGEWFCVAARFDGDVKARVLTIDPATGRSRAGGSVDESPYLDGGRLLGRYVSSYYEGEVDMLGYGRGGERRWSRPYTEVFGPGASSDAGWAWIDDREDLPLIGLGHPDAGLDYTRPFTHTFDLTGSRLVGLDPASGATLWRHEGLSSCAATDFAFDAESDVIVACRYNSGSMTVGFDGVQETEWEYADLDVDLLGLDAETGEARWEVPLGAGPQNVAPPHAGGVRWAVGADPIVMLDGSAAVVDRVTGEVEAVPDDASLLCEQPYLEAVLRSAWSGGEEQRYPVADRFAVCSSTGEVLDDAPVAEAALEIAGFDPGEFAVVNLISGVTAFGPVD